MQTDGSWDDTPLTDSVGKTGMRVLRTALEAGINFFDHAMFIATANPKRTLPN